MSLSTDLLAVARYLCPSGSGRPAHAYLRRCISTAYYAVFHALADEVARPYSGDVRLTARRTLDHGSARDIANTLLSRKVVPWLSGHPACDGELSIFAEYFEQLQLARHRADYDLDYTPTKPDAITAMDRADRAIKSLGHDQSACPEQVQVMCVAMMASPNQRKRLARSTV